MKRKPTPDQVVSLLERQRTAVLACLMKGLGMPFEEAVDLMYTTLAELVLRLRHCSWPRNVRKWGAYLLTMAVHAFLRPPLKDARLLTFHPSLEVEHDSHPCVAGPAQLAERAELVARVRAALGRLDVLRQTAVLLWASGYSGPEIARTLSISPTHARVLKCQALKTLRITLKEIA